MKALAQAVPNQVIAGGYDATTVACLSWLNDGKYSVYLEVFGGGYGAASDQNGCDAIDSPLANCANTPVEAVDQDYEFFRVEEYSLRTDSFGHGRHRGGVGFQRAFRILKDRVTVALYGDRFKVGASGLFDGGDGTTGSCEIHRDGEVIMLASKDMKDLKKGDLLVFRFGGGAGYGPASERAFEDIDDDIRQDLLTPAEATRAYPKWAANG